MNGILPFMVESRLKAIENESESRSLTYVESDELRCLNFEL
jgi:hypothetical protein